MVWWRRSDKHPTVDGDASSVFSLDSGSLSAADTSLAESSSGRSSGGDAPGPSLSAPPAPSADHCRLTPDVVTAFEHGLDMPVAALGELAAGCPERLARGEAGLPDVVLLQHMLSRNTSTPPDSHSATPSSSDPPTPVRGRSEDPLARLTAGDATPKRNESLRRRMAKSMAVETKQGLAHVKQCGATHCTGYDGVHGVEDITLTIAGGSADAAAAFGLSLDADSRVTAVTKGSQAES